MDSLLLTNGHRQPRGSVARAAPFPEPEAFAGDSSTNRLVRAYAVGVGGATRARQAESLKPIDQARHEQ
jgi:hypothetical protein